MATEGTSDIAEDSEDTRNLCVQLYDVGGGLERNVYVTLNYESLNFANEGKWSHKCDYRTVHDLHVADTGIIPL